MYSQIYKYDLINRFPTYVFSETTNADMVEFKATNNDDPENSIIEAEEVCPDIEDAVLSVRAQLLGNCYKMPLLDQTQIDALTDLVDGTTIFNTTTGSIATRSASSWVEGGGGINTAVQTALNLKGGKDQVNIWTKQQNVAKTGLTDAEIISWDLDVAQSTKVTLTDNRTLANPSNQVEGTTYIIRVIQDSNGSRTLAFGSVYKWPEGTAPTLTTTANAVDLLCFISDGTNMLGSFNGDYS